MSTEIQLIAACLAQPEDDTPRLVLADWYDENGTTDAQAARAEWIRLTSDKKRPKGRRLNGEPAWLKANAHRLWPHLWAKLSDSEQRIFRSNHQMVVFRVSVPDRSHRRSVNTVIRIRVKRGITSSVSMNMVRAQYVATTVATDEPLTPLRLSVTGNVSRGVIYNHSVPRRPFELAGMGGVWDGLEGWTHESGEGTMGHCRLYDVALHRNVRKLVYQAIDNSFTRWARAKAGVPHILRPVVPAGELQATKLVVPDRILPRSSVLGAPE